MTSREGKRPPSGSNQERKIRFSFRATLKRQFQEFMKVITRRGPAQPRSRKDSLKPHNML